jgi:hypothetical protein
MGGKAVAKGVDAFGPFRRGRAQRHSTTGFCLDRRMGTGRCSAESACNNDEAP